MTGPVEHAAAAYLRVQLLLSEANEAQWQAGQTPVLPEDTTERSIGLTSDPTAHSAMDERRMSLRDAVVSAEAAQAEVRRVLAAADRRLSRALAEAI